MDITRFTLRNDNAIPFDSTEFDAGYLARLSGEPQCLGATPGWRAGWPTQILALVVREYRKHPDAEGPMMCVTAPRVP